MALPRFRKYYFHVPSVGDFHPVLFHTFYDVSVRFSQLSKGQRHLCLSAEHRHCYLCCRIFKIQCGHHTVHAVKRTADHSYLIAHSDIGLYSLSANVNGEGEDGVTIAELKI